MKNEKFYEENELLEEVVSKKETTEEQKQKKVSYILITGILILAIIMAFATFYGVKEYKANKIAEEAAAQRATQIHHINAHGYDSWSIHYRRGASALEYYYLNAEAKEVKVSADLVNDLIKQTVATVEDKSLDNRTLQYYYAELLYELSMSYSDSLMYMLDTSAPFDAQKNSLWGDGTQTWQKYFIDTALQRYHTTMAVVKEAEANNFVLPEEKQTAYEEEMYYLEMMAMSSGYPDADVFMREVMGPMATVDSYKQYMYDTAVAKAYTEELSGQIDITPEQINAFYEEHKEDFEKQFITKDDQKMINVRHILIKPETAEDGTITDAAWAAAEKEAQRILKEWQSGEATEESFGELATLYTTDTGSQATGGLYEDVAPGQMVQPFNDWCFDETRQSGDTGIVKYHLDGHYSGYHVMYFVSQSEQAYWEKVSEESILAEEIEKLRTDLLGKYELTADYGKIVILEATVPTAPSTDQNVVITETAQ